MTGTDKGKMQVSGSGRADAIDARRAYSRHDVELDISLLSETNFYLGLTENLSEGGLFIATHAVKPIGTKVEFSFKLPQLDEPIQAIGTVRWVRVYSETSDTSPGMGVRFDQISSQQIEQIRRFLATRAPLFFDED
jgi:uncharacterized protein (TIGR02266 family)